MDALDLPSHAPAVRRGDGLLVELRLWCASRRLQEDRNRFGCTLALTGRRSCCRVTMPSDNCRERQRQYTVMSARGASKRRKGGRFDFPWPTLYIVYNDAIRMEPGEESSQPIEAPSHRVRECGTGFRRVRPAPSCFRPQKSRAKRAIRRPYVDADAHQRIGQSTDCQLDRLADPAEHLHERIDGELGRFLVHHVGHARARNH